MREENRTLETMEEDAYAAGEDAAPDAPQGEETQVEAEAGETDAAAQIAADIRTLYEDGWTADMLQAFAQDEQARSDVQRGLSARQAATAYLMRSLNAAPRRRGVPTIRTSTTSGARERSRVEQMSAKEFAAFSDAAYDRVMAGEKVAL